VAGGGEIGLLGGGVSVVFGEYLLRARIRTLTCLILADPSWFAAVLRRVCAVGEARGGASGVGDSPIFRLLR
jgi:hypothetical protein